MEMVAGDFTKSYCRGLCIVYFCTVRTLLLCLLYSVFVHLIHICAVATVALHALRAWPTLHSLRRLHTLHPWVAGVGHAGGAELDPPHTWRQRESTRQLSPGGVSVPLPQLLHSPQASHSITVFFKNSISFICKTASVERQLTSLSAFQSTYTFCWWHVTKNDVHLLF